MNSATPFYFAAKAFEYSTPTRAHHPRVVRQRRRRFRFVLFPALRPQRGRTTVGPATPAGAR
jgi:hypothetical protein